MQNVIRYSAEKETKEDSAELRYGVLTVGREDDKVFVTCGNVISTDDIERLQTNLTSIQKMDKKELKNYGRKPCEAKRLKAAKAQVLALLI